MIWTAVSLCAPSSATALAFGISLCLFNVAGVIIPSIQGKIIEADTYDSFQNGLYFAVLIACIGAALCISLFICDMRRGGILWHPENGAKVKNLKAAIDQVAVERLKKKKKTSGKFFDLTNLEQGKVAITEQVYTSLDIDG